MSDPVPAADRGALSDYPRPLVLVRRALRRSAWWLACTAVVLAVLGGVFGPGAQWGDVATWVVAATTFLAFLAAVFAGLEAYQLLRVELGRDRVAAAERAERRDAERRAQAASVAAWHGDWKYENAFYSSGGGVQAMPPSYGFGAVVVNGSGLPVYEVRVSFCIDVAEASGLTWRQGERYLSNPVHVVPPGKERVPIPAEIREAEEADGNEPHWLIAIEFTDAAGVRWLRDARGRLGPADPLTA